MSSSNTSSEKHESIDKYDEKISNKKTCKAIKCSRSRINDQRVMNNVVNKELVPDIRVSNGSKHIQNDQEVLNSNNSAEMKDMYCGQYMLFILRKCDKLSIAKILFVVFIGYIMIQMKNSQDEMNHQSVSFESKFAALSDLQKENSNKFDLLESKIFDNQNTKMPIGTVILQDVFATCDSANEMNDNSFEYANTKQEASVKESLFDTSLFELMTDSYGEFDMWKFSLGIISLVLMSSLFAFFGTKHFESLKVLFYV